MAFANSLHSQYLGTSAGMGLRKAFEMLGRKGLMKQETKGPFWHDLDEGLWHIGEANFRALWCEVAGVETVQELNSKSPEELVALVEDIYSKHASRSALVDLQSRPHAERDQIKEHMTMFSMDILPYFDLREAIRIGDVGRIEDLLPTRLFRFAGGGNHKYATEILELIQKLQSEWPEPFRCEFAGPLVLFSKALTCTSTYRSFVRRYCWLINRTGKRDGFLPVDLGQEHNIRDIKVNWRSFGPGATFAYIQVISPAITIFRAVRESIHAQFLSLLGRGMRHGTPSKGEDVSRITAMYQGSQVHRVVPGRIFKNSSTDCAADFVSLGADKLVGEGTIDRWWSDRSFERSTAEIYSINEHEKIQSTST